MDQRIQKAIREGYFSPVPGRALWNVPILTPRRITDSTLETLIPCLQALDELYLRAHPETPWLYSSGVRYIREPAGQEKWLTIPWALMQLQNPSQPVDCEDLACWRAAELVVRRGQNARAIWTHRVNPQTRRRLYHIKTQRASGEVEDPSAALGMGPEWAQQWGPTHSIVDGALY